MALVQIEPLALSGVDRVSVTTTAQTVEIKYRYFYLQNQHESAKVYFRENTDGKAVTSSNGILLKAGGESPIFCANSISLIGSEAASVAIVYLN